MNLVLVGIFVILSIVFLVLDYIKEHYQVPLESLIQEEIIEIKGEQGPQGPKGTNGILI